MPTYQKVLSLTNPTVVAAVPEFDKLIIHQHQCLYACSLSALARFSRTGLRGQPEVNASLKRITGSDHVLFARVGKVGDRTLIFYATKGLLQVTLQTLEMVDVQAQLKARQAAAPLSEEFRVFGESVSVPKDAHGVSTLVKNIAICGEKGMLVVDPTKLRTAMSTVPDFRQSSANAAMGELKSRCDDSRPLGLVRCPNSTQLMAIYRDLACFVDKHGVPTHRSAFVRWETPADTFVQRGNHVLLFSPSFIEVREVNTGRLVQVIEGADVRLLHMGGHVAGVGDGVLIAMRAPGDGPVQGEKLVELLQTAEIATPSAGGEPELWDEWDMAV